MVRNVISRADDTPSLSTLLFKKHVCTHSHWLVASRDLNELRRLMPTTMIEMMLTLDPVMYIIKPCIANVLAGDCAIPMAICDGKVVETGSRG